MSSEIKIALIRARLDELAAKRAKVYAEAQEIEKSMNSLIEQLIAEGFSDDDADMLEESLSMR